MRRRLLIAGALLPFIVALVFIARGYVLATNNAFPYTKHGGATTDNETPCAGGVNRGLGAAYGGDCTTAASTNAYNYLNAEAGKYMSGECNHCHELHASFGGIEPEPNAASPGAQDYLLFYYPQSGGTYISLCNYCHNNMSNISGSGSAIGTGRYGFFQGRDAYVASSHYVNNTNMYWPGTTGDPVDIYPRRNRSTKPTTNKGSCLNCHTPHGIKETSGFEFDTTAVPSAKHLVAANASVNYNNLIQRQLIAWEEALCERCHDSDGPASANIKSELAKRETGGSGHPVHDTALSGVHTAAEAIPVVNGKHVECYDCHNPHSARTPTGVLGDGSGGRIQGMKYVDIKGVVQNPTELGGTRQPFIYEVCLKCHGDSYEVVFASDTPFPDAIQNREGNTGHYSNKRKEFDPESHHFMNYPGGDIGYNTAYHPVAAPGRNGTLNLCMQLESAFGLNCSSSANAATSLGNLTINCTDCHNNEDTAPALTNPVTVRGPVTESSLRSTDKASAYSPSTAPVGPHGSNRNRLLRGNYLTTNSTSGSFGAGWYSANRLDTNGRPKFELCFLCHAEDRLLGNYTNFGGNGTPGSSYGWTNNLHGYHLNSQAVCHDCHHNVHSNVEAQNTIYGNGLGAQLPPDSQDNMSDGKISTHLLNFGPQAAGQTASKPRWYYDFSYFRCNLVCHGRSMSLCNYNYGGSGGGRTPDGGWCGG
ncbi:MAG: hypothetical protein HY886_00440 [Deltaproteobacteria bacterium]|nr:hypothetical protein [Deltaproteobacteria bacterium]